MSVLIRAFRGNYALIASAIGCSRRLVSDRIRNSELMSEEVHQAREQTLDEAEAYLESRIKKSDYLLSFFMRTRGRSRGYSESSRSDGQGSSVTVNIDARTLIAKMREISMEEKIADTVHAESTAITVDADGG